MPKKKIFSKDLGFIGVVCVDQSYTRTGISVWNITHGNLLNFQSVNFEKHETHKDRRIMVANSVVNLISIFQCSAVIIEEARMFPSAQTKARLHEINATISNAVDLPVYELNTTSYRAVTVGTKAKKEDSVKYCLDNYKIVVNDDIADSVIMGEAVYRGVNLSLFD